MTNTNRLSRQEFEKSVANHQMTVLRDDGVNRHLRFGKPGTGIQQFDLITWPGHLCYTGDMGTYVFARLEDMFEFFRSGVIDMRYWAEKCISADRDGIKCYSVDRLREVLYDIVESYVSDENLDEDDAESLRNAVKSEILSRGETELWARNAADGFVHDEFRLSDFWEYDLSEFTYRFRWCCLAMAWGIQRYDLAKRDEDGVNDAKQARRAGP